jgi:GH25 family lysozyme M1 (1,4-beta-N-acetylmuramidase)
MRTTSPSAASRPVHVGLAAISLSVLACLAGCSGSPGGGAVGTSGAAVTESCGASASGPVQGVDVSEYQGNFDWAAAHVTFGYARISDGTGTIDPTFDANWANMHAAGVLRGAYQFFEPGENVVAQANLMVSKVGRLQPGDMPAMIDVEVTGGESGGTIGAEVAQWLQIVEAGTGRQPIIYTGSYFWQDSVGDTGLGSYPVWIAAYGPACPSLPPGWSAWSMWQYSDGGGSLDHDVWNGTLAEIQKFAGIADGPPTAKPSAPSGCGAIEPGQGLVNGQSYASCDGRFALAMQTDGNLVLYDDGVALWDTGTNGTDGEVAVMQGDGNFVLYGKTSDALWASGTSGHPGSTLALQTDGNLVVYDAGKALWASGTNLPASPAAPTACGAMAPGQGIVMGQSEKSCGGRYSLIMQTDGNLVLYDGSTAIWATGTEGKQGYMAVMQGDGNFVLYDRHSVALWSSGTAGHGGADLAVQADGNLVVYAPSSGPALWDTGTNGR